MVIGFDKISSHSPIWVFQSNKILDSLLVTKIEVDIINFLNNWTSHNLEIKSSYKILHGLFLIISVESNFSNPSGCSIDKLINFIKKVKNQLIMQQKIDYNKELLKKIQSKKFSDTDFLNIAMDKSNIKVPRNSKKYFFIFLFINL